MQALLRSQVILIFISRAPIATFQDLSRHRLLSTDFAKSAFTAVMSPSSCKLFPGQVPSQQSNIDEGDDLSKVGEGSFARIMSSILCMAKVSAIHQSLVMAYSIFIISFSALFFFKMFFFFNSKRDSTFHFQLVLHVHDISASLIDVINVYLMCSVFNGSTIRWL